MNDQQKAMITNYVVSYNNFDINGMTRDLASNIVFKNISNGNEDLRIEGIDSFKDQANSATQYFTERKQTIESWKFEESKVTIEIAYKATLAMDFPNGMKKGETLEMKGTSVFEFQNMKIKSITDMS